MQDKKVEKLIKGEKRRQRGTGCGSFVPLSGPGSGIDPFVVSNANQSLFHLDLVSFPVLSQIKPQAPRLVVPFRQFL